MGFIKKYIFVYFSVTVSLLALVVFCANLYSSAIEVDGGSGLPAIIVIDAGHGGEDGGAVAPDGGCESALNLEIAKRLDDFLHLLGIETKMLRTEDRALYSEGAQTLSEKKVSDLKNRVRLVNEAPSAVLVSIHQNMFAETKYDGLQVFYSHTPGSQELAESLQTLFALAVDPGNHRSAKPAESVYLMKNINCTGVLVECGFLSNENEYKKLQTSSYQKQIAMTLADGLGSYLRKVSTNEV